MQIFSTGFDGGGVFNWIGTNPEAPSTYVTGKDTGTEAVGMEDSSSRKWL